MDLSSDEDLSIAVMNMISMEEHFFFTGNKTGDPKYFELLNQIREMRKVLLKRIIKDYEGEVWCISKHLLAASMRLMEYGTKLQSQGKKDDARDIFQKSYDLYSLFWGLNLDLITAGDARGMSEKETKEHEELSKKIASTIPDKTAKNVPVKNDLPKPSGFMSKLGDLVKKAIDCCIE